MRVGVISDDEIFSLCAHYRYKRETNTGRTYLMHQKYWLGEDLIRKWS